MAVAVIGKVVEVNDIDGADFIRQARVVCGSAGKWSGVVGRDIMCGDIVAVFLQDALLPPDERWAFMQKHKWRVRMARFKGVPSECVILRVAPDLPIGTDIGEMLGVVKYEKPMPAGMSGEFVGPFPSHIPKTDEPNFQTVPELVERMNVDPWYATEKADGTSCTVYNDGAGMHVCSRNWELREFTASGASNIYWIVARQYGMERLPQGLALQFEIVGPGIQSNPMNLDGLQARAFSLFDTRARCFLPLSDLVHECTVLNVPAARLMFTGLCGRTEDELRKMAEIRYGGNRHAEGIVVRAMDSSWSFKVINLLYKEA